VDITVTLAPQFDDLIKRQDYRQIYDRRSEFGLAFIQDDARAAQLKDIVERLGKIDMMVGYANAAVQQNNGYAAWELLESAAQLDSTDPVLANARADIAPRVADFAQALDSAQRAAKDGNYATSLNYYLAAQDIYPASQISHDGIELVSKQLMAKLNPDGPTAHALAEDQAKADAAAAAAAAANAASTPAPVHAAVPTTSPSSTTDTSDANADSATTTTNSASNQGDESAVRDTSSTAMTENTGVTKRDLSDSTKGSGVPNTLF
jgi:tetratricopeptide (TPR) repeat protein